MTFDQLKFVGNACMLRIAERMYFLDLNDEQTDADKQDFIEAVRGYVATYQAAWSAYQDEQV